MKTTLPPLPPLPETEEIRIAKKGISKFSYLLLFMFTMSGIAVYNSYNNNIFIAQEINHKPLKRLDELEGKIKPGQIVAKPKPIRRIVIKKKPTKLKKVTKKLTARKSLNTKKNKQKVSTPKLRPLLEGELNLVPSIVFNTARGEQIKSGISGTLQMTEGVLNQLVLNLPSGESLEISSNREMNGNVFQYFDRNYDQEFSGMFYQISKRSYMVTLSNQPGFEGMRIQFDDPNIAQEASQPTNANSFRAKAPRAARVQDNPYGYESQAVDRRESSYDRNTSSISERVGSRNLNKAFNINYDADSFDQGYDSYDRPEIERGFDGERELMQINDPYYD